MSADVENTRLLTYAKFRDLHDRVVHKAIEIIRTEFVGLGPHYWAMIDSVDVYPGDDPDEWIEYIPMPRCPMCSKPATDLCVIIVGGGPVQVLGCPCHKKDGATCVLLQEPSAEGVFDANGRLLPWEPRGSV